MKTDKGWEERARELFPLRYPNADAVVDYALQLGREMADARAEEIARKMDAAHNVAIAMESHPKVRDEVWREAMLIARSTIQEPKTREQVLEEALQRIAKAPPYTVPFDGNHPDEIARRALEWKP